MCYDYMISTRRRYRNFKHRI